MDITTYQHMNIRMSTRGKRPLRNLTPSDKVRAIQRIHKGETKASVSRDIGVPESTLRGWCKNEQKLRFMCRQLGTEYLDLSGLDNPPEKRTKFIEQLSAPKFGAAHNMDYVSFNRVPYHTMDFASNSNALFEKIGFSDCIKKNGLNTEVSEKLDEGLHVPSTATTPLFLAQNNMIHQLNMLSLLSSNLGSMTSQPGVSIATSVLKPKIQVPAIFVSSDNDKNFNEKTSTPILSVKNWAKDPASHSEFKTNDSNGGDDTNLLNNSNLEQIKIPEFKSFSTIRSEDLRSFNFGTNISEESGANVALLDWCKIFNASLNILTFAAVTASFQPNIPMLPIDCAEELSSISQETKEDQYCLENSKSHVSFLNYEMSNESCCDTEPEDLSLRSVTSKSNAPSSVHIYSEE